MSLVILTGASGSGKTAIAEAIEMSRSAISVFRFDTIGVPCPEIMATYGSGHQPGGAWQRETTIQWINGKTKKISATLPSAERT